MNYSSNFNKLRARSPILAGDINIVETYFKILRTTVTLMNQNNRRNERFEDLKTRETRREEEGEVGFTTTWLGQVLSREISLESLSINLHRRFVLKLLSKKLTNFLRK